MATTLGTKPCARCGAFDRNAARQCAGCAREWQCKYRLAHPEKISAINRATYLRNPERTRRNATAWTLANPDRAREIKRRWAARNRDHGAVWHKRLRDAERTHTIVHRAIKRGLLSRPSTCEQCGQERAIEAAHWTYERPLDVRWLCRPCHRKWDAAEPKSAYSRSQRDIR